MIAKLIRKFFLLLEFFFGQPSHFNFEFVALYSRFGHHYVVDLSLGIQSLRFILALVLLLLLGNRQIIFFPEFFL